MFALTPATRSDGGRFVYGEAGKGMPQWAKVFVLLTGMLAWLAIVAGSLWLKQVPNAFVIGFPAGLWLALTGRSTITAKLTARSKPAAEVATTDEKGDSA